MNRDIEYDANKLVDAIADGYGTSVECYTDKEGKKVCVLLVENPEFVEDDGSMPYIGVEVKE